ncbi:type I-F CRISPR-associated protein Csy2 [Azohydromonas caseinilytica]|uniref:Type I-F CRISPR-associated protein Csy2 n=1 Tax=Azohydromonas caseinilytica TaxID=2728836 RepID=A0A848FCE8_9BURK|nr:type I-F CRISPR-associated protein Csy2 [Azohydromonas caseinilytica]NML15973.1 type I-F CRISPR-associated protein Csy2 [Azohydromonas caseinilytica]
MSAEDLQGAPVWRRAVLLLPRLRIQNANAVSSPMTWGWPAMTAFLGAMTAAERRLGRDAGIKFYGVGMVCHGFEPQVTRGGYTRSFHLTRNPVLPNGATAAIVEEGRAHLDLTLVFDVEVTEGQDGEAERQALAQRVAQLVQGMRIAGGSVMPALPGNRRPPRPLLELLPVGHADDERKQFRRLMRRCLPGFALVSRDDLLQARLEALRQADVDASPLDAWLDLSRLTSRAHKVSRQKADGTVEESAEWRYDSREGWIVPIPVGFAGLSGLHPAGSVAGARDAATPLRFVEGVYSIGQWISPHRLRGWSDLFWWAEHDEASRLYRCRNDYAPLPTTAEAAATES